jgi:hypothetical protein
LISLAVLHDPAIRSISVRSSLQTGHTARWRFDEGKQIRYGYFLAGIFTEERVGQVVGRRCADLSITIETWTGLEQE